MGIINHDIITDTAVHATSIWEGMSQSICSMMRLLDLMKSPVILSIGQ